MLILIPNVESKNKFQTGQDYHIPTHRIVNHVDNNELYYSPQDKENIQ